MKLSTDQTLLDYFYYWENETPDKIYLRQPFGDTFRDFTWKDVGEQARKIAGYFKSLHLPEKSNIGIISKNCAEWIISDLAIMMSGNISVPFYPTLVGDQLKSVLIHSDCKYLFVGKLDHPLATKTGIPEEVNCISFPGYNPDPEHIQWNEILAAKPLKDHFVPKHEDLASIIYTSGTTGNPKGVMTTFGAFSHLLYETREITLVGEKDNIFFSYLPLSHIAERTIIEAASMVCGGTIYFAESLESFAKNLQNASPTHFLAVPRIWTKFQLGILSKMPQKKLNFLLQIPLINSIIKKKIKAGLGLTRAKLVITGAAPMPVPLLKWFRRLDINIQEAYGMTENLAGVCAMPADHIKDGTVGKLHPKVELKLDEETNEIMTRAPWNMAGYYKEPQMTKETITTEGWLKTGDVGELDNENYLTITGRVKEMYKTSKGEYVVPSQIEMLFSESEWIEQICVVGQSLPQPIALVILSDNAASIAADELTSNLEELLHKTNEVLKSYEKVKCLVVLKEPWTEDNNCLTPTLKIKRPVIEKRFEHLYQSWFDKGSHIVQEAVIETVS